MRRVLRAELRDSWPAWLGVCFGFVVTNFALALSALAMRAGSRMVSSGELATEDSASLVWAPGINLVICALVGAVVIGSSTSLVVDSRRGSLARLALAGATPGQVVGTVMVQLIAVSLACSVVGDVLALALLGPTLAFLAGEYGVGAVPGGGVVAAWPVLLANLFAVALALFGGLRQANRASRIPPVEALRQSSGGTDDPMTVGRYVGAGFSLVVVVGVYLAIPAMTETRTKETLSTLLQASIALLVLTVVLLSRLAPVLVGPLTRAWTRIVWSRHPAWYLTRRTTAVKGARLSKSVVPVMTAVALLFGILALTDSLLSSARANGMVIQSDRAGAGAFAIVLSLPLLIALSGGVGSLVMMSKQRDADLALTGIVGATPAQRVAMPVLEGVVITITGALLGVVAVAVAVVYLAVAFAAVPFRFAFVPSVPIFVIAFTVTLLITTAATVLPTLGALRRPEPAVIARLVAE